MGASEYKQLAKQIAGRAKPLNEIEETDIAGTVTQLQLEIAFDDKVKEMALFKDGELSKEDQLTSKERNAYYLIRSLLTFVFFVCIPFMQTPGWCLEPYHDSGNRSFGSMDCDTVSAATGIRFSNFPNLSPLLTCIIDFICLIGFCVMACLENKWRN